MNNKSSNALITKSSDILKNSLSHDPSTLDYEAECYEIVGEVISLNESTFSKTHVSGGGHVSSKYGGSVNVNSTTTTHGKLIFWLRTDEGKEERIEFTDSGVEVRESHIVKVVYSRNSGKMLRLKNVTTGYFWRFGPATEARDIKNTMGLLIMGFICSLPVFNIWMAYGLNREKTKKEAYFSTSLDLLKPNVKLCNSALLFAVIISVLGYLTSSFFMTIIVSVIILSASFFIMAKKEHDINHSLQLQLDKII